MLIKGIFRYSDDIVNDAASILRKTHFKKVGLIWLAVYLLVFSVPELLCAIFLAQDIVDRAICAAGSLFFAYFAFTARKTTEKEFIKSHCEKSVSEISSLDTEIIVGDDEISFRREYLSDPDFDDAEFIDDMSLLVFKLDRVKCFDGENTLVFLQKGGMIEPVPKNCFDARESVTLMVFLQQRLGDRFISFADEKETLRE